MQKLVIIGASHAYWEISELIADINAAKPSYEVIGILDDNSSLWGKEYDNLAVDGPIDKVIQFDSEVKFILAIGSYRTRIIKFDILERLNIPDERFETLIHPTAKVYSTSQIRQGCIVHYGSIIYGQTVVEAFSLISANCVIGPQNYIGRGALLGSNITTTTAVKIGSYSFIGSSTTISENIEIEPGAKVGIGSLVLSNIKAGSFVLGNPLRVLDKIEVPESIINRWNIEKENNKLI